MTQVRRERADAARNRRAILLATEELLRTHRPERISMEQVAAAAGVGKGTVFHRFGSRMGLMRALMEERAFALNEAVAWGPPPLGPGAPPRERLLAFVDALVEVVGRNKGLLAALGHAATTAQAAQREQGKDAGRDDECRQDDEHSVYSLWHDHLVVLLAAERPDLDAALIAHMLLGSLQGAAILRVLEEGGAPRLAEAMRALVTALLHDGRTAAGSQA